MGISTVSGPFRSKNGFQELVNGEWVPVAGGGGGGGGFVPVHLYNSNAPLYGATDNRYSNDNLADPPTGPTAGNIIQLPPIALGGTYYIDMPTGSTSYDAWALQLPAIPGTDLSSFSGNRYGFSYIVSTGPVSTVNTPVFVQTNASGSQNILYIYNSIAGSYGNLGITFSNIITVDGFGTIALFSQSLIPFSYDNRTFDPHIYPVLEVFP